MTARAPRANNFDRPLSKDETDRADICARRDEMRSAECGMKVIERNVVGQVGDRKTHRNVRMFLRLVEQIVHSNACVEDIAGNDAGRVRIVVLRSRSRNADSYSAEI